ncbi:hypothetical protein BJV78DRAFT_40632 [Lactifluus subvellereus]|nr:hypothetical protein BJV78DRAFT_40632 [Lactifluus subvellereus]
MHSLVALPRIFHLSSLQRIESAEPAPPPIPPREKMLASQTLSAGHIISLIGVGFVVLLAHILPIVKLFFPVFLPMQTLILIAHSTPSLSSSSSGEVDSLHSLLSVSFPFILFLHFNPRSTFSAVDYFLHRMAALSPQQIHFSLVLDLTVTRTIPPITSIFPFVH